MSCYLRHIKDALAEQGVELTPQNKKLVDQAVHRAVGTEYKDCPAAWRRVKERMAGTEKERRAFIRQVKEGLG